MESKKFPHDFLWGGAVAAHQLGRWIWTRKEKEFLLRML